MATAQAADEITEHLYGLHTGLHPEKNTYECEELCTRREEEGCSLPGPLQRLLQTLHGRIQKDSQSQVSKTLESSAEERCEQRDCDVCSQHQPQY